MIFMAAVSVFVSAAALMLAAYCVLYGVKAVKRAIKLMREKD